MSQYYSLCCQVCKNQSSPVLGLYVQLKCCRSHLGSACWGSSAGERSPGVEVVEGVGERLCLWWAKWSLQTKAPRWVHCHHLWTNHLFEFLWVINVPKPTRYVWSSSDVIKRQNALTLWHLWHCEGGRHEPKVAVMREHIDLLLKATSRKKRLFLMVLLHTFTLNWFHWRWGQSYLLYLSITFSSIYLPLHL